MADRRHVLLSARWAAPLAAALLCLGASQAEAGIHYYRNSIDTRTAPADRFLIEVPAAAAMHGGYFKVETGPGGRVLSYAFQMNGKPTGRTVYIYATDSSLVVRKNNYVKGALIGYATYQRDGDGQPTRIDNFTAQGALTGYLLISYSGDQAEEISYAADGSRLSHVTEYFSADGAEIRSVGQDEGSIDSEERTYDPARGTVTSDKTYENGNLTISKVNTYDANDDLIRTDIYDDKGVWYSADTYDEDLHIKRLYKFSDGNTEEIVYTHDRGRNITGSQQTDNGRLTCRFMIERLSNGAVKRSLALGPDGSLWAEYPNMSVTEVDRQGHPPGSTAGDIHHTGDWW